MNDTISKDSNTKALFQTYQREMRRIVDLANTIAKGCEVEITGNYNGQPYGRSKASLKGTRQIVERVLVTEDGIELFLKGHRLAISADDVRFT